MNLKQLIEDDDAVSPVIGVILMVAITVILAAVIGTFVLGLGDNLQDTSPTAQFSFEQGDFDNTPNGVDVRISHSGGDSVKHNSLTIAAGNNDNVALWNTDGEKVTAGDTVTIDDQVSLSEGEKVKLIWASSSSEKTQVIGEYEVS